MTETLSHPDYVEMSARKLSMVCRHVESIIPPEEDSIRLDFLAEDALGNPFFVKVVSGGRGEVFGLILKILLEPRCWTLVNAGGVIDLHIWHGRSLETITITRRDYE